MDGAINFNNVNKVIELTENMKSVVISEGDAVYLIK